MTTDVEESVAEQQKAAAIGEKAKADLKKAIQESQVVRDPDEPRMRAFICPQQPNARFLIKTGQLVSAKNPASLGMDAAMRREGDIWVQFASGVCATADPDALDWLEAHGPDEELHAIYHKQRGEGPRSCTVGTGLCRDAADPMTEVWAEFKSQQIATSKRDATIAPGINVDQALARNFAGVKGQTEAGKQLVESAEAAIRAGR